MRNLNKEFEHKNIEYNKLLEYGFTLKNNHYIFEQKIRDNHFKVQIDITKTKQSSKIIDLATDEEYILIDIQQANGDFSGKIKEEYENILKDIITKCTTPNIFKSKQTQEIIKYIKEKYNDDLEYLWEKSPNNAIWRNKANHKWYGILLVLPENKLGIASNQIIEIINLKYPKNKNKEIINNQNIFAGYHMNQSSWITIKLDESIDNKEIFKLIDNSYQFSIEK